MFLYYFLPFPSQEILLPLLYSILPQQLVYTPLQLCKIIFCTEKTVSCPMFPCSPFLSTIETVRNNTFIYLGVLLGVLCFYPLPFSGKSTPALYLEVGWLFPLLNTLQFSSNLSASSTVFRLLYLPLLEVLKNKQCSYSVQDLSTAVSWIFVVASLYAIFSDLHFAVKFYL